MKGSRRDHGAVDVFDAEIGEIHQLAHAQLLRFRVKRVAQGRHLHNTVLQSGERFGLRTEGKDGDILVGFEIEMF